MSLPVTSYANPDTNPLVSVVLPVYNAEKYIAASIRSILDQTYRHFELVILDDGSTDGSADIIRSFDDQRIRFIQHDNMGMAATLNKGIALAKGSLIARQDADDISYPERLEKQVVYFRGTPETALLGTAARIVNEKEQAHNRFHRHPVSNAALRFFLLFDNPFVHSTIMMQKNAVVANDGYDLAKPSLTQDFDLWSRISLQHPIANLPDVLLDYTEVVSGISQEDLKAATYHHKVADQSEENLLRYSNNEKAACRTLAYLFHAIKTEKPSFSDLWKARKLLVKLVQQTDPAWKQHTEVRNVFREVQNRMVRNARAMYFPRLDFLYYLSRDIKNKILGS